MIDFDKHDVAIDINNLTKSFGSDTVLNNLNFKIPRAKITTILGFSGAGKSTLLKHLLGVMRPTEGSIHINGVDMNTLSGVSLREFRRNFGMVFQYAALFDSLNAFENVAFPLKEFTEYREDVIKSKVIALLNAVGLKSNAHYKIPSELSGGMRKRVGLARALALEPSIILYDEPTTGLDPITTQMVNELIVDVAKRNQDRYLTSVIISHDIKASLKISDFIAFLDHGRIIEYLPVADFVKSENPIVKKFLDLSI